RAPDGSVILNRAPATVYLSSLTAASRPLAQELGQGTAASGAPVDVGVTPADPWSRTGAVPYPVLQTLQSALERTAAARAYKLRVAQAQRAGLEGGTVPRSASLDSLQTILVKSAPDAVDAGASLQIPARDERRASVRMAGPPMNPGGGTTRFLLS